MSVSCPLNAQTGTAARAANDFLIVPGVRVGPIRSKTSERDLRKLFGDSAVVKQTLPGAEGEDIEGTVVWPRSPDRVEIFWADPSRTKIATIRLPGAGAHWHTAGGLSAGNSLSELVRKNSGKPFHFSGFGWDYGGYVSDWGGGPLGKVFGQGSHMTLRLGVSGSSMEKLTAKQQAEISGDRQVSSANPALRQLKPYVGSISVDF